MILSGLVSMRDGDFRSHTAARKLQPSNFNPVSWLAEEAIDEGLTGAELRETLRWRAAHRMILWGLHETLPEPHNRIRPSETETDSLGIPRPEIHFKLDDYTSRSISEAHRFAERLAKLYGAEDVEHDEGYSGNNHITGATIMGYDPRDSVVNGDCRTHDHPNLWIASSSTFPSVSSVNVTLTIAATAIRIADHIATEARP
jgi:choline dehydrogenase-like flavoprotein